MISDSTFAIKMFAKETAIFVPIAVPCVWRKFFPLKWKEFSFKISLSISLRTASYQFSLSVSFSRQKRSATERLLHGSN